MVQFKIKFFQLSKYFLKGFTSEITNFHHIFRSLICKFFNGIDTGSLQTVIRTNLKFKLINAHLKNFFFFIILFLHHNLCGLGVFRKIDKELQVLT